ncbi:DUF2946 domain-containing protein [Dickeya undicola]|uniref:DUF2946 domain-containing protein n=1 Tax=Dickeya undicola TaxID=1577887 RepID=UPI000907769D
MSLFELRQWRTPAWLGILAIVMIFLAPIISQSLRASHHVQISLRTHHHAPSASLSVQEHHSQHSLDRSATPKRNMDEMGMGMGMDHAACGYCVLLSHLPLLALSSLLQPTVANWSPRGHARLPVFFLFQVPRFLAPLPRAPPRT